ncbi:MAG: cytidylate kinase-like family protein [Actinomycetota bacterium]|nr:cytidylate kinase-like family protein [Actinomycetota bacterium]
MTISAGYGAGGSVVAPAVAVLLGFTLLDRAMSSAVAAQLSVSVEEAECGVPKRSATDRFMSLLAPLAGGVLGAGTDAAPPEASVPVPNESQVFRDQAELIIRSALPAGAVVLGRAGAAVLRAEPGVLRVRLFGPVAACIVQAQRIEHVTDQVARQRLHAVNQARRLYVQRLYQIDIDDPSLFHLQIDTTAIPLDACAELIAAAYHQLVQAKA